MSFDAIYNPVATKASIGETWQHDDGAGTRKWYMIVGVTGKVVLMDLATGKKAGPIVAQRTIQVKINCIDFFSGDQISRRSRSSHG